MAEGGIPTSMSDQAWPTGAVEMLPGGGEMGAFMHALDWSATPIVPAESWPQGLREEYYFTFSYSPIRGEGGMVGGACPRSAARRP